MISPSQLEGELKPLVKQLGLNVKVTVGEDDCYQIYAWPKAHTVKYAISAEQLFHPDLVVEITKDILMRLQAQLFDIARSFMDERDVRGRVISLPIEDKHLLHELLFDAERGLNPRNDKDHERHLQYRALVERLTR